MVIPTLFLVIFLLQVLLYTTPSLATSKPSSSAKPGCPESCGNGDAVIPFPFGIGPGCFLDDWFEIDCRNASSTPFLKRTGLEVLSISLPEIYGPYGPGIDGMIRVIFPVFSNDSCTGHGGDLPSSLVGSNFIFSPTRNMFVVVGCDVLALMNSSTSELFGCKSGCGGPNFGGYGICPVGSSCCHTTLPFDLQDFKVEFKQGLDGECSYAFLADQSWVSSNYSNVYSLGVVGRSVPVVLEWGISNRTDLYPLLNNPENHQYCGTESLLSGFRTMPFSQCHCWFGYKGNGYLVKACQDVNECEEPPYGKPVCPSHRKCVNTQGGYRCIDRRSVPIGIGSAFGALLLMLCVWRLYKFIKKRKAIMLRKKYFERNGGLLLQQQLNSPEGSLEGNRIFTSKALEVASDNFNQSRVLGLGGQGAVYKGMLADGRIVAIKKSMVLGEDKLVQFINEVAILSQINHRNIVKLLGCCLETQVPLLVYEFVPNGTLYEYLHKPNEDLIVTWEARLRIASEVAGALSYLHSAASIPIYHRDIKSTNILLDEKYRAKVADFGTSKSVSLERTHVTTMVQGTFGYLDPEYFRTSRFTDKSDVYSFGVVLVELLTGQMPVSSARAEEGRGLAAYFIVCIEENQLFDILHPQVKEQATEEEISRVADLARRCLQFPGRNRPTMKSVAAELEEVRNIRFSSGSIPGKGNSSIIKENTIHSVPGGSKPDTMVLTSTDEPPLPVMSS